MNSTSIITIGLLICSYSVFSQTVSKSFNGTVTGAVCPELGVQYEVSLPTGFSGCLITWTITNGTEQSRSGNTIIIKWNDTPGAKAKLKATFSNCGSGNESNNGKVSNEFEELILSVKNQSWGSFGNSVSVDYCTKGQVLITMPRMFVQGTGGIGQPAQTEVAYAWTLPDGWKEVGTGRTGFFGTPINFITIEPINCSKPSSVTVFGTLAGAGPFCGMAEKSATATIALNGANPVATVGPQPGYTGGSQCNTTPVTFYATTNVALGCIGSYNWTFPLSWSFVSQSGNSITLQPSGNPNDSNPIKATLNFTCGSSVTSGNYVPPYTASTLASPSAVCYSGSQLTLNNVPAGASVTWTAQPSNLFTVSSGSFTGSGGNHNILLAAENSNTSGSATITFSINAGCGNPVQIQQTLWAGNAQIQDILYPSSTVTPNQLIPLSIVTTPGSSNEYYKAEISRKFGGYNHTVYGNVMEFSLPMTGTFNIKVYADNVCGWPQNFYPLVFFCLEGGGMFAVYPNPTDNYFNIEMSDSDNKTTLTETETYQVTLIDDKGTERLSISTQEKKKRIDTSHLKNGQYILRILYKGEVALQRITIDR
jgi:hypothetical protein